MKSSNAPAGVDPPLTAGKVSSAWKTWALLAMVLVYILDFHFDVRRRDAFSWMDPTQYYRFALDFFTGQAPLGGFDLPSIFPFLLYPVMAVSTSIPAALWINVFFLLVLAATTTALCRRIEIKTAPVLALVAILSSPLMVGLSRELYTEFALTAVVALQFLLWFQTEDFTKTRPVLMFSGLICFGLMMKMTYPVFFLLPFVAECVILLHRGRYRHFLRVMVVFAAPVFAALVIERIFFPKSFSYYLSLGNTTFPIMYLLGPHEVFSLESILYYPAQVWKTMLFLLAPLLVLALFSVNIFRHGADKKRAKQDLTLWLWLLGPIVVLTFQSVKEPRHIAPCIVPIVLLAFRGLESMKTAALRIVLTLAVLAASLGNYVIVTGRAVEFPYFLDSPLSLEEIERTLLALDEYDVGEGGTRGAAGKQWKFRKNIAIAGFKPNEALAVSWHFHPGIVFDLDLFQDDKVRPSNISYEKFEDLYTLTSFNVYNRRSNWHLYLHTLEKEPVVEHAEYVIVKDYTAGAASRAFPGHSVAGEIRDRGILILKAARKRTVPYRILYARKFLAEGSPPDVIELNTIFFEMFMVGTIADDPMDPATLLDDFPPGFRPSLKPRNIYHYKDYYKVFRSSLPLYEQFVRSFD